MDGIRSRKTLEIQLQNVGKNWSYKVWTSEISLSCSGSWLVVPFGLVQWAICQCFVFSSLSRHFSVVAVIISKPFLKIISVRVGSYRHSPASLWWLFTTSQKTSSSGSSTTSTVMIQRWGQPLVIPTSACELWGVFSSIFLNLEQGVYVCILKFHWPTLLLHFCLRNPHTGMCCCPGRAVVHVHDVQEANH